MAEKDKPTSNIPRLSKLPVRNTVRQANTAPGRHEIPPRPDSRPISVPKSRVKLVPSNVARDQELKDDASAETVSSNREDNVPFLTPPKRGHGLSPATQPVTATESATNKREPSLSDRASQSLSRIPPSPSPRRRQSGFFPSDSPAIRPPSALSRNRPVTSIGFHPPLPSSRPTSPTKHPPLPSSRPSSPSKRAPLARPSQAKVSTLNKPLKSNNLSAKNPRQRQGLLPGDEDASSQEIHVDTAPAGDKSTSILKVPAVRATPVQRSKPLVPDTKSNANPPSARAKDARSPSASKSNLKSSAALREAVANARAAKRAAPKYEAEDV
ncbi:MAG: hypothetical protein Q9183_005750, partial [Haloplaca sp. 2 TL-2023]